MAASAQPISRRSKTSRRFQVDLPDCDNPHPTNQNYNSCHPHPLRTMVQEWRHEPKVLRGSRRFVLAAGWRFRAQNTPPEEGPENGARQDARSGSSPGRRDNSNNEEGSEDENGILAGWRDGSGAGAAR